MVGQPTADIRGAGRAARPSGHVSGKDQLLLQLIADWPELAEVVERIRDLAARTPDLVVTITVEATTKRRWRAPGAGYP